MSRTVHIKGQAFRLDVYSSRLYLRKILHPKDGDIGYAIIDSKELTLVWNGKFHMWCKPGFTLEIANPTSPGRNRMSA